MSLNFYIVYYLVLFVGGALLNIHLSCRDWEDDCNYDKDNEEL